MNERCSRCGCDQKDMMIVNLNSGLIGHLCGECKHRHGNTYRGRPGYIYIIGHGDYWKCGITTRNPERRITEMQTGNPHKLKIAFSKIVKDCKLGESLAHKKLSAFHHRGEWFRGEEKEIINALIAENNGH